MWGSLPLVFPGPEDADFTASQPRRLRAELSAPRGQVRAAPLSCLAAAGAKSRQDGRAEGLHSPLLPALVQLSVVVGQG